MDIYLDKCKCDLANVESLIGQLLAHIEMTVHTIKWLEDNRRLEVDTLAQLAIREKELKVSIKAQLSKGEPVKYLPVLTTTTTNKEQSW